MSALLRALIGQDTTTEDNNLAVIKNHTLEFDSEGSRRWFPAGVTARLNRGITYHVSLDYKVEIIGNHPAIVDELQVDGKYLNGNIFNLSKSSTPVNKSGHFDGDMLCLKSQDGTDPWLFELRIFWGYGKLSINNLKITEVK